VFCCLFSFFSHIHNSHSLASSHALRFHVVYPTVGCRSIIHFCDTYAKVHCLILITNHETVDPQFAVVQESERSQSRISASHCREWFHCCFNSLLSSLIYPCCLVVFLLLLYFTFYMLFSTGKRCQDIRMWIQQRVCEENHTKTWLESFC